MLNMKLTASSPPGRLVLKREKRDEKTDYDEPDVVIPSSRWLRLAQAKLCLTRREAEPAYTGYQAGSKMDMYLGLRAQSSRSNHPG